MKISSFISLPMLLTVFALNSGFAQNSDMVILNEASIRNLQIQTVMAEERLFETRVFAIGRIEEIPENHSVLSSRIAGRIVAINAFVGDTVEAGEVVASVESRQPGDPPPVIPLQAMMGGTVLDSRMRIGQPVEPNEELMEIADHSAMWAVAQIPEQRAALMEIGTKARIHVHALGEEPVQAELVRFGVKADRGTGTVEGIFRIANEEGKLRPGMRAEFSIVTDSRDGALMVPREAIQGDPSNRFVFVRDFDLQNAFIKVPVELGQQNDQFVEVLSGVFPGDDVVTRGSYSLAFAGGGGMSLKEALDAAHGHEHAEDGSELPANQSGSSGSTDGEANGAQGFSAFFPWLAGYAILITLICLGLGQSLWRHRKAPVI